MSNYPTSCHGDGAVPKANLTFFLGLLKKQIAQQEKSRDNNQNPKPGHGRFRGGVTIISQ